MKSIKICFAGLVVLSLMGGCGPLPGRSINPLGPITGVATAAPAKPTNTARPSITPVPAPSRRATFSVPDTSTPIPTISHLAIFTLLPTKAFTLPPGVFIYYTPTAESLKCHVGESYPAWGQAFKPRTDFVAKWRVYNSGSSMWHVDDILFGYVSGEKMQNPDREDTFLPITIYVGDKINLQVHMVPPKEPGIYTATWGLRRSNKKDFFCTFLVNIQVVKK